MLNLRVADEWLPLNYRLLAVPELSVAMEKGLLASRPWGVKQKEEQRK